MYVILACLLASRMSDNRNQGHARSELNSFPSFIYYLACHATSKLVRFILFVMTSWGLKLYVRYRWPFLKICVINYYVICLWFWTRCWLINLVTRFFMIIHLIRNTREKAGGIMIKVAFDFYTKKIFDDNYSNSVRSMYRQFSWIFVL